MWCIIIAAKKEGKERQMIEREQKNERKRNRNKAKRKKKLLALAPQSGSASSVISKPYAQTSLQASHTVCHLLPAFDFSADAVALPK